MSAWAVLVVALMLAFDLERPLPALELTLEAEHIDGGACCFERTEQLSR